MNGFIGAVDAHFTRDSLIDVDWHEDCVLSLAAMSVES